MATQTTERPQAEKGQELTRRGGELESDRGTTTIADGVVAKVVGLATREVPGVHDLGGAPARALSSVTSRVGVGDERTRGVSVEVGKKEAAADLTVVVEYGESIPRVTTEVRENVIRRVEGLCGLKVTEVNVAVNDLHFPGEETEAGGARVE
jgi:uncharacterized alkaline shock family protein YloU